MQYVAVIGAMDVEVTGLRERLQDVQAVPNSLGISLWSGACGGTPVLLAQCGIGKVNAALCTQYLVDHFPVSAVINSGVAGALHPGVKIGDLIVSEAAMYHDFDVRYFNYPRGVIPQLATSRFPADERLTKLAMEHSRRVMGAARVHCGLIVSGDQFVAAGSSKRDILSWFPDALCVEMEGSAVAHAAFLNRVPFVILRAVSDQAGDTAPAEFDAYLAEVIPALNTVVTGMVTEL